MPEIRVAAVIPEVDRLPRWDQEVRAVFNGDRIDVRTTGVAVSIDNQPLELCVRDQAPTEAGYNGAGQQILDGEETPALDRRRTRFDRFMQPAINRRDVPAFFAPGLRVPRQCSNCASAVGSQDSGKCRRRDCPHAARAHVPVCEPRSTADSLRSLDLPRTRL